MLFATPDDVAAIQKDVAGQTKAISTSLGDCVKSGVFSFSRGTSNDPTMGRDWKTFMRRAVAFLNEDPSWIDAQTQYDRGLALLHELNPGWYDRVNAGKCAAPNKPAAPPDKPKGEDWFGDWGMLVGVFLVAVALHEAKGL